MQPAEEREHLRILASYGGIYENARLQGTIEKTVDRLVAASERPDLKYKVSILNSPAINAFALPNGHLYITRGLIAPANDKAELASVLAHEMGHVIARHAAIREDQARQAALIGHVVSDVLSDPPMRVASTFSPAIRRRPIGSRTRSPMPGNSALPARANATVPNISAASTEWFMARIRARAFRAAAAFCTPSSALLSWRRRDSRSTTPRRRCSASRAATRRCASTW